MSDEEKKGRFVKGRYVIDEEPDTPDEEPGLSGEEAQEKPTVEQLITQTSKNVDLTVESVVVLGKTLFMTEEGREHIELKTRKIGLELQKAVNEIAEAAKELVERK